MHEGSLRFTPKVRGIALFSMLRRMAAGLLAIRAGAGERRRLRDSLQRQLELTQTITDNSSQAVFMMDASGRCTFMNPAAERMFGWTFEEIRARPLHEMIHHHHRDGSPYPPGECPVDRVLPENFDIRDHEDWFIRRNGEFFPVTVAAAPIFRDGKPVSTVIEIRDVTERKRAEQALQFQSVHFEDLIHQAPIGIYVVDEDFRICRINAAALQAMDATGKEIVGSDVRKLMHVMWEKDSAEDKTRIFRHSLETGEPYFCAESAEVRADRKVTEYYEWRINRITLPDGRYGLVCYFRDISAQVQARLAIADSEERFRALITVITDVVWSSQNGAFVSPQPSWQAYTGQDWEQYKGFGWANALHPDERETVAKNMEHARRSRDMYTFGGRLWHAPSHSYRHVLVRGTPLLNPDGTVREWVGSCTDVEEQTRLAEERQAILESERAARSAAEHAGRMKDEFLATLSHELRTPLSAILGYAGLMLMKDMDAAEMKELVQTIEKNARAQAQMIEDLLDMNRIVSGKVRLDVKAVDIRSVIGEAVKTISPTAQAKNIRIDMLLGKGTCPIRGDAGRIQQVLWNLLSNAVRFTPHGGTIQVVFEQKDSQVEVTVTDTGAGIPAEFLPYVFDRFRQADGSVMRRHGGLGLGLAIAKQLVELHGGTIRASSPGEGQGASFTVSLPVSAVAPGEVAAGDKQADDEGAAGFGGVDLNGVRVLAVDDEPETTRLVKRVLEEYRAEVVEAGSAAQALDVLSRTSCDVLVCDIGMPGEDGYQLIRKVRTLHNDNRNIPAMALTAFARSEDRRRAALAGFQTHLSKPVEAPELLAIVANLAGKTDQPRGNIVS